MSDKIDWPERCDDDYIKRLWHEGPEEIKKLFQQEWPFPPEKETDAVAKDHHSPAKARAIIFGGSRRGGRSEAARAKLKELNR